MQFMFLFLTALLAISCGLFLPLRVWFFGWPLAKLAAVLPLTQGADWQRREAWHWWRCFPLLVLLRISFSLRELFGRAWSLWAD